jgi:hypothetical protein
MSIFSVIFARVQQHLRRKKQNKLTAFSAMSGASLCPSCPSLQCCLGNEALLQMSLVSSLSSFFFMIMKSFSTMKWCIMLRDWFLFLRLFWHGLEASAVWLSEISHWSLSTYIKALSLPSDISDMIFLLWVGCKLVKYSTLRWENTLILLLKWPTKRVLKRISGSYTSSFVYWVSITCLAHNTESALLCVLCTTNNWIQRTQLPVDPIQTQPHERMDK